jgi:uncharacterized protein YodC (DUF2158 family)
MKPLTKEQLRDNAAAMLAFADGKPIQFEASAYGEVTQRWFDTSELTGIHNIWHRPKPQPVTRPWSKPEDAPLNCWIRVRKGEPERLVTMVASDGLWTCWAGGGSAFFAWSSLDPYEHSTDRKTWKPCTVEDAQ